VAHDFNNLLAAILLHVRWLERDPDAMNQAAGAIRDLAEEGAEVIQELLVFSRRETSPMELVDVADLVRRQETVLRHLLPAGVELRLEVSASPAVARANPVALRRLVLNLVLNARDAVAARGGRVEVEVGVDSGGTIIEVVDDGQGIEPEHREHLFEPFFSLRREGRGAGLGLAVVYAVVTEHGGDISVDSAPGRGTRITVRLPLCESEEADQAEGAQTGLAQPAGRRILVVRADGLAAGRLMEQLSVAGFESRHASTLADASCQVGSFEPHAVVADLDILEGTAGSFVAELRRPTVFIVESDRPAGEMPEESGSVVVLTESEAAANLVDSLRQLLSFAE
jgi:two-component system NtrC family sensor kinase